MAQATPNTAEEIAERFGIDPSSPARPVVRGLYEIADRRALDSWRRLFRRGFDFSALEEKRCRRKLRSLYDVEEGCPERLLFSIHTYFALVVKAVAAGGIEADCARDACGHLESRRFWLSRGFDNFVTGDLFDWYLQSWDQTLDGPLGELFATARDLEPDLSRGPTDLFSELYQSLVPAAVRHGLGEYYTPRWLAELTLDELQWDGRSLLDPTCGSGTFLMAALSRLRSAGKASAADASQITARIVGFDINPLAVLAARANYLLAIGPIAEEEAPVTLPVYERDALDGLPADRERFAYVVGNPPWINWEHLSEEIRERTRPMWHEYGLFSLSARAGRLGGGKKDLSMLLTFACVDRCLEEDGSLGFLITRSVFKSKGAGAGFRKFRFQDGSSHVHLVPRAVHDLSAFQPFEGATTETAMLIVDKKENSFEYPVPYYRWTRKTGNPLSKDLSMAEALSRLERTTEAAHPVDPDDDSSPWLTAAPQAVQALVRVVGPSDYRAYEGVNSGGLNGCYWVRVIQRTLDGYRLVENQADLGRIKVERTRCEIEADRVFPLLRSGGLQRWRAEIDTSIILAQDPQTRKGIPEDKMKREFPRAYEYFCRFEGTKEDPKRGTLRGRSLFRRYYKPTDPFYSMYGVGPYTMSPWKVCWTRIDTRLRAVVVGPTDEKRPVLPQETITFVPLDDPDEAHYFCALFNSTPADALVRAYSTGKGFASAHVLEFVGIPEFDGHDEVHQHLANLSKNCHEVADNDPDEVVFLEEEIDACAAQIWELSPAELNALQGP